MKNKGNNCLGPKPTGRTVYKCDICPFGTINKKRLEAHKNHKHTERKPKIYKCEFCEYATPRYHNIKSHMGGACKVGANNPTIISIIGNETICLR